MGATVSCNVCNAERLDKVQMNLPKRGSVEELGTELCSQCNQFTNKFSQLKCCRKFVCKNGLCNKKKNSRCPNGCDIKRHKNKKKYASEPSKSCPNSDFVCPRCEEVLSKNCICVERDKTEQEFSASLTLKRGHTDESVDQKTSASTRGSQKFESEVDQDEMRRILLSKTKSWANFK
ncbi:unnamed protein product [Moneuplotes crassus]|uniref:Uncharacterized protein n=1 Tax=Euplotes crassus TaxID=5936 RepID=A0AAD2D1N9_EUPCR|nr:unnamed protein product [Moneuplotes crassus]